MIHYRRQFGKMVTRWAGGFGPVSATMAAGAKAETIGTRTWAVLLLVAVMSSFAITQLLDQLTAEYLMAAIWGVFIGLTLLFFFPQKLLITFIGALVGSGVSDLAGVAKVIDTTATAIQKIVHSLNSAFGGVVTVHPLSAWIFLGLLCVCCLPAYRE